MTGTYDPTDEPNDDRDDAFQVALAKQRLRKELGLGRGLSGVGNSVMARLDSQVSENLRHSSAVRAAGDPERVKEAREAADPDGLLTRDDVKDVLERAGVEFQGCGCGCGGD